MEKCRLFFKNNKKEILYYFFIFMVIVLLYVLFPYSHDDWAWGSKIGVERLTSKFYNYNGRWAGNLLVMLLTRSYALKTIFVSLTMVMILFLMNKIIDSKDSLIKYFNLLFVIAVPHLIFRQCVTWVSGFTNYVFPTLLILLYIYFNKDLLKGKHLFKSKWFIPLLLILGLITSLCVEHLTLYCLVLGLFINVFIYIKNKKIDLNNIFYFIGVICGTILMFSNEAYHQIANNADGYRNISPIYNAIHNYFNDISRELVMNNFLLNILISFALVFLLYKVKTNKKIINIIKNITIAVLVSFPIYMIINGLFSILNVMPFIKYINGLLVLVYLLAIFIGLLLIFNKNKLFEYLFLFFSIAVMTAPLFVVHPIGSRCFFTQYILFSIITTMLLEEMLSVLSLKPNVRKYIKNIVLLVGVTFYLVYLLIYLNIFRIYIVRQKHLYAHKNDDVIVLPIISSDGFLWNLNPKTELFQERFKLFYNIDVDKQIELIPYKEWKEIYK